MVLSVAFSNPAALVAIRERTGFTQSDLAKQSGVSQGRISELESASMAVRPGTVKALAAALQVPFTAITCAEAAAS